MVSSLLEQMSWSDFSLWLVQETRKNTQQPQHKNQHFKVRKLKWHIAAKINDFIWLDRCFLNDRSFTYFIFWIFLSSWEVN